MRRFSWVMMGMAALLIGSACSELSGPRSDEGSSAVPVSGPDAFQFGLPVDTTSISGFDQCEGGTGDGLDLWVGCCPDGQHAVGDACFCDEPYGDPNNGCEVDDDDSTSGDGGSSDPTGDDTSGGGGTGGTGGGDLSSPPPEVEITDEEWEDMNTAEKLRCFAHPIQCTRYVLAARDAIEWSSLQGLTGAHNGPWDAVRHAYWMAHLTDSIGAEAAKLWGDAHEDFDGNPIDEMNMDQHNNAVGRGIGEMFSDGDIGPAVNDALDNGELRCIIDGPICSRSSS